MAAVRVLVAEDSLTIRKYLCEILSADPDVVVVGEAENGKQAIELCTDLRPNVITMDMMMPMMSGLSATEYIMAYCPTPILVVSSSTNRGELFKTYDALAAGAVDVLDKPMGDEANGQWEKKLISTVKLVSRIRTITHPRARLSRYAQGAEQPVSPQTIALEKGQNDYQVIGIGASTGGPAAIAHILRALPQNFKLPILLVMHIGEIFGESFADWLDSQTTRSVVLAQDGMTMSSLAGCVVMAPPNWHVEVQAGRLRLNQEPERHSCRPSVDVLFESIAREYGPRAVTCLLTGMGRDGAAGLLAVRRAGGLTIAQDEASSVIYGMPREAVLLNAAVHVLPLSEIAPTLLSLKTGNDRDKSR